MSPRTIFLLTLAGVLLAGLPLPLLTGTPAPAQVHQAPEEIARKTVYTSIQYSGNIQNFRLRHDKGEWKEVDTQHAPQELELQLPLSGRIELEVEAQWQEPGPQAVTLTLEPDGLPVRSETQWMEEGSNSLHTIFTFTW